MAEPRHRIRATLIGSGAPTLWATIAVLALLSGDVPPFQLTAMAFLVAALASLAKRVLAGESLTGHLRQPWRSWAVGVYGLFGFHVLFFLALRTAPAVEVNLLIAIWPIMLVLLSAALPEERLRWWHVVGVAAGFVGVVILVGGGGDVEFRAEYAWGFFSAIMASVVWASYSMLNRRHGDVPSEAVGGFVAATAVLALACHLAFEATVWPSGLGWLAVLALGIGPLGIGYFMWDHGTKHGDLRVLAASAYAEPMLGTVLLIAAGFGALSWTIAIAGALILGGAAVASQEMYRRPGRAEGGV